MSSTHHIPIHVRDPITQVLRHATSTEFEAFKANKLRYSKWLYSNRKALHDELLQQGMDDKSAWREAFNTYPKPDNDRPRFVFEP
jgi:hypothetical protein